MAAFQSSIAPLIARLENPDATATKLAIARQAGGEKEPTEGAAAD
jgi:hypothetical protein